jgi:hypothetical protein
MTIMKLSKKYYHEKSLQYPEIMYFGKPHHKILNPQTPEKNYSRK